MVLNLGEKGEVLAKDFLEKQGFRVISRNFRTKFGEIDLIGIAKDKTLVFFEVKTMTESGMNFSGLRPEDQVSRAKILKFKKIAQFYANTHSELVGSNGYRLDLITIVISKNSPPLFNHYENIY